MPIWKLQSEFAMDSLLPRDVLCITPHFNDEGVGSDPQQLCDDLAAAYNAKSGIPVCQITVTAYDAEGAQPVYPAGEAVVNVGASPASTIPREVALCLSYYGTRNVPSQRGRLYIPGEFALAGGGDSVRPTTPQMTAVAQFAPIFQDLGGVDVDWVLWSRKTSTAWPVTNWWVDNEWDTVRSRGLRANTRQTGTTSEG